MLRIVTDGAIDLPAGWQAEYDIQVLPLHVRFGQKMYVQGVDLDEEGFYRLVKETRTIPKTSLPSLFEIQQFYRKIARPGDQILSIHVSRKLSGTFSTVQVAAEEIKDEFEIYPFDSAAGSVAMAFMARAARILNRAGCSIEQVIHRLEQMRAEQVVIFTLDNLDFAHMNGRVTAIQSLISSALSVKPILILRDGMLEMGDKVRTRRRSLQRVLDYVQSQIGKKCSDIAVIHANDLASGQWMLDQVRQMFNYREFVLSTLSVPVAANLGPATIGIVAIPNQEEEK